MTMEVLPLVPCWSVSMANVFRFPAAVSSPNPNQQSSILQGMTGRIGWYGNETVDVDDPGKDVSSQDSRNGRD